MTPSALKSHVESTGSLFFKRSSMKFFGDTMGNYGVRETTINTLREDNVAVYELYRKNPVKYGLQKSVYFCKKTYQRKFKRD